jgi:hypothetical protein
MTTLTVSLHTLDTNFTGRNTPGFPGGYDPTRQYRLHPRNRAEVWKTKHRRDLLQSILSGRYIPAIIVNRVNGDRLAPVYEILDGGNRVSAIRRILRGGEIPLTAEQRLVVQTATIEVKVLDGMTPEQIRDQFRLLNRSVRVSHGHLYHMSEADSPLVRFAAAIIANVENPLRVQIIDLFTPNAVVDNASKGCLENVVAMCAGAQHGEGHLSKSFDVNESILREPVNEQLIVSRLNAAFEVFRRANARQPMEDARIKKGNFNVGRYLAGILYDLMPHGTVGQPAYERAPEDIEPVLSKWSRIIAAIHAGDAASPIALAAVTVPGANNINPRKLRKMSKQVGFYLEHNRMPNADEMREMLTIGGDDASTLTGEDSDVSDDDE